MSQQHQQQQQHHLWQSTAAAANAAIEPTKRFYVTCAIDDYDDIIDHYGAED